MLETRPLTARELLGRKRVSTLHRAWPLRGSWHCGAHSRMERWGTSFYKCRVWTMHALQREHKQCTQTGHMWTAAARWEQSWDLVTRWAVPAGRTHFILQEDTGSNWIDHLSGEEHEMLTTLCEGKLGRNPPLSLLSISVINNKYPQAFDTGKMPCSCCLLPIRYPQLPGRLLGDMMTSLMRMPVTAWD